mgnify:CR=1 FL=1|tara:strand:- start:4797 stop:5093 length:297 start_codon:yes stop_codon:yes gene_type:complete
MSSIEMLTGKGVPSASQVSDEVSFLSDTLSLLRDSGKISNDAFLEAGIIQGGLNVLSSMITNGAGEADVRQQMESLISKVEGIQMSHPELDSMIEMHR